MTKLDIVNAAFNEMALTGYVFQLQAEDIALALSTAEAAVAVLDVSGIQLNWPYADDISSVTGNDEVDIPPYAYSGLVAQIAIDLSSAFGKSPAPTTMLKAKKGYEAMLAINAVPNKIASNHYVPLGSGNKGWRSRRVFMPTDKDTRISPNVPGITANVGAKNE